MRSDETLCRPCIYISIINSEQSSITRLPRVLVDRITMEFVWKKNVIFNQKHCMGLTNPYAKHIIAVIDKSFHVVKKG